MAERALPRFINICRLGWKARLPDLAPKSKIAKIENWILNQNDKNILWRSNIVFSFSTLCLLIHMFATSTLTMGGSSSKPKDPKEEVSSFAQRIKENVETEIAKRAMMQREVQMSINIAKARDNLQIFGSLWLTLMSGVGVAKIAGRKVPSAVGIPIVVGAVVLGNMADLAYGNKLQRVTREAEYILDNEKARFVPLKQAPFRKFYTDAETAAMLDQATAVGDLWPSSMCARPSSKPNDKQE